MDETINDEKFAAILLEEIVKLKTENLIHRQMIELLSMKVFPQDYQARLKPLEGLRESLLAYHGRKLVDLVQVNSEQREAWLRDYLSSMNVDFPSE